MTKQMSNNELNEAILLGHEDIQKLHDRIQSNNTDGYEYLEDMYERLNDCLTLQAEYIDERFERLKSKRKAIYDTVVRKLQTNDKNAAWDEILIENDGNYTKSFRQLRDSLQWSIDNGEPDDEEYYTRFIEVIDAAV